MTNAELRKLNESVSFDPMVGWTIPYELRKLWEDVLYPDIDLDTEMRKAHAWRCQNTARTYRREHKFLQNWFKNSKPFAKLYEEQRMRPDTLARRNKKYEAEQYELSLDKLTKDIAKKVPPPPPVRKQEDLEDVQRQIAEWKRRQREC